MGTKTCGASMIHVQRRATASCRKNGGIRHVRRKTVICPFTLEPSEGCAMLHKASGSSRAICRFSLEGCMPGEGRTA